MILRFTFFALLMLTPSLRAEEITVMVWNVERGANHFDQGPEKALEVIKDSGADVVLMQESYDIDGDRPQLGIWLAKQLEWQAHQGDSPHLCILSKYPVAETFTHAPWHGIGARLEIPKGFILVWSCWIDYRAYLPYRLAENEQATVADLLKCENEDSDRAKQTRALLARLKELGHLDSELPLLVGGDWNSPSHLDYGEDTKSLRRGLVIPIPTSLAFEKADFTDTYRHLHPDPIKEPGHTWSPLRRHDEETGKPLPLDRIDRLYLRSSTVKALRAKTLPDPLEDASIPKAKRTFPSDHSALVTSFDLNSVSTTAPKKALE